MRVMTTSARIMRFVLLLLAHAPLVTSWQNLPRSPILARCHTLLTSTPCSRLQQSRHLPSPRSHVVAYDMQNFRDSWEMASNMVFARVSTFVVANIIATLAWQGLSKVLEEAREKVVGPPPQAKTSRRTASAPPVAPAREIAPEQWLKLIPCLLLDLGGDASYLLPLLGDVGDTVWAPTSAVLLRQLFKSNSLAGIDFVKEALPGTDIIPVATIAWAIETFAPDSPLAKALGIQDPSQPPPGSGTSEDQDSGKNRRQQWSASGSLTPSRDSRPRRAVDDSAIDVTPRSNPDLNPPAPPKP